jgi:hypothetical protein
MLRTGIRVQKIQDVFMNILVMKQLVYSKCMQATFTKVILQQRCGRSRHGLLM